MPQYRTTGLREADWKQVQNEARKLTRVRQLLLFGSRAKGTHKTGSDVDLAIKGDAAGYEDAVQLAVALNEEIPLPYFFDVVNYGSISEPALREHIDRVGLVVFDRELDNPDNPAH